MTRTGRYLAGGAALLLAGVLGTEAVRRSDPASGEPTLAAPTATLPAHVSTTSRQAASTDPVAPDDEARLAAAESEIVRLTDALARAQAENAELRTTLALRDTVLDTLKASVAERDASLADVRARLAANETELAGLRDRLGVLQEPADFDRAMAEMKLDADGPSAVRIQPVAALLPNSYVDAPASFAAVPADGPLVEVQFDFASAALSPGATERAALAAATLSGMTLEKVRIVGHTDRVGRPEANRRLAARRADAVARFLVQSGLPEDLIVVDGAGEAGAPVQTGDGVAEPLNRSVLIFAQAKPTT